MRFLVIKIQKQIGENISQGCFEPIGDTYHDLITAQEAKMEIEGKSSRLEEFIIIQCFI